MEPELDPAHEHLGPQEKEEQPTEKTSLPVLNLPDRTLLNTLEMPDVTCPSFLWLDPKNSPLDKKLDQLGVKLFDLEVGSPANKLDQLENKLLELEA